MSLAISRASVGEPCAVTAREDRAPGPGEVAVSVAAAGLCFVEDALLDNRRRRGTFPRVLGHEGAGVVTAVGAGVADLAIGDAVSLLPRAGCGACPACVRRRPNLCRDPVILGQDRDGCWADTITLPRSAVLEVPPGVPMAVAAVAGCAGASALRAASGALAAPGDTVLVRGVTTGIGLYAALLCGVLGAGLVFGVARSNRHADALQGLGIEPVVAGTGDASADFAAVRSAVGGDVDAIVDAVADWRGQDYSRLVHRGGRIVFVGDMTGIPVSLNPSLLIYRQQSVLTADLGGAADVHRLLRLVAAGRVRLPTVEHPGGVAAIAGLLSDTSRRHAALGRDVCMW
jgi:D-arabinose 1-dehydrogenase-like Zn-dependent alcohol dehydrogenase